MSAARAPGYSVDLSDAARVMARRVRGLGGVVPIDFGIDKGNGYRVTLWYRYQNRSTTLVRAIQLRREREGPYFHQFIVFELKDNAGLFRIDRRLRPNEAAPLNSLNDEGIPAFDTIEPVISWNDPLFAASDCLISVEFKVDVHLWHILNVCRAIQTHPLAKVYTLQRFNCYFFAQTLLLCVACGASDWCGKRDRSLPVVCQLSHFEDYPVQWPSHAKGTRHASLGKDTPARPSVKAPATTLPTSFEIDWRSIAHSVLSNMDVAPGVRGLIPQTVRTLRSVTKEFLNEVGVVAITPYIDQAMARTGLWDIQNRAQYVRRKYPAFNLTGNEFDIKWKILLGCWAYGKPEPCLHSPAFHSTNFPSKYIYWIPPSPVTNRRGLRLLVADHFFRRADMHVDSEVPKLLKRATQTRLNSFAQNMVIKVNSKAIHDRYQESEELEHNLGNIPRYTAPWSNTLWQRIKTTSRQEPEAMVESSIIRMQQYLAALIQAHSNRVQEYKWLTKADATEVAQDISKAMDEVWATLIEQ